MTAIAFLNTLTNPTGIRPFGPVSIRWDRHRQDWCATNVIEDGWSSTVYLHNKRLAEVLGRLCVTVVGIRNDDHSMYYLCEPGTNF